MADQLVRVAIVANEPAADVLCSLLRTEGIRCMQRVTDVGAGALDGVAPIGSREVLVNAGDAARARELVASASP
ncbi:MAG: DUF2007 domain-containing protein [Thermoleophilaceae bacterium]|nr:DUF2007 domain-containing protein [Thermoleophilaceae bacterium]